MARNQARLVLRNRVQALLESRGIKPDALADAVDRSPAWASLFLRGKRDLPLRTIEAIAHFFDLPVNKLFIEDNDIQQNVRTPIEFVGVPLVRHPIAAGRPLLIEIDPDADSALAFRADMVARYVNPICLRVGKHENSMHPVIQASDVVMIDQREDARLKPRGQIFAVNYGAITGEPGGALKQLELDGKFLHVWSRNEEKQHYPTKTFHLKDFNLLDAIRGEVVWVGRYLGSGKEKR